MGIGDIGWSELLFLFALALLLLGPRRLPEIANAIGRSLREFRRALNEVQDELRRETQIPSFGERVWGREPKATGTPAPETPADESQPGARGPEAPPAEPRAPGGES